jgi:hypothetical protein
MTQGPPFDPLSFWREQMEQFREAAARLGGQPELARQFLAPLQAQADLFQRALEQQATAQEQVVRQVLEPLSEQVVFLDAIARAMREQADLFDQAAESLRRAGALLRTQSELFEKATEPVRRNADLLQRLAPKGAGGGTAS